MLGTQTFGLGKAGLGRSSPASGSARSPAARGRLHAQRGDGPARARALSLTGVAVLALAAAPVRDVAFPLLALVGFLSIWMIALANTIVQLRPEPSLAGRVMGLWTMVLPGLSPVTALVVGALTQYVGPREGYGIAGGRASGRSARRLARTRGGLAEL